MIHYSCIGATGYVCGEVLRMMVNHHEGRACQRASIPTVSADAISTLIPLCAASTEQVIRDPHGGDRPAETCRSRRC